jgi:uncharacterized membrane protein
MSSRVPRGGVIATASRLALRREGRIVLAIAALYFVLYSTLAVLRHESYHSLGFDLGLFDQAFWNTTQGRPFESTMSQALPVPHSLLGDHFSPIFWLIVPFYFAFPHPETLAVVQTFCLALGAWPLYLLAKLKLPSGYAIAWTGVYFLFLPVAYINLFDFHEVALAVAPLAFALYFLEAGRRWWFVASLAIAFLVKEEMGLVGIAFGAYALIGKRDWKLGLGVLAGSAVAFAAIIQVVIPFFAGGRSYPYIAERYADVGGSPLGIIRTAFTNPLRIVRAVLQAKKVFFVVGLFGPVLGLSALAGWSAILVLPSLAYLVLSNYGPQFSYTSQYSAPLIPLIVGTSIIALSRLPDAWRRPLMAAVLVSSLGLSWAFGDMPFSRKFDPDQYRTEARYAAFTPSLAMIPPDARVSAQNGFPSQLSERQYIYDYSFEGVVDAQWVVLDYAALGHSQALFDEEVAKVEAEGYVLVASGEGLALLTNTRASA